MNPLTDNSLTAESLNGPRSEQLTYPGTSYDPADPSTYYDLADPRMGDLTDPGTDNPLDASGSYLTDPSIELHGRSRRRIIETANPQTTAATARLPLPTARRPMTNSVSQQTA